MTTPQLFEELTIGDCVAFHKEGSEKGQGKSGHMGIPITPCQEEKGAQAEIERDQRSEDREAKRYKTWQRHMKTAGETALALKIGPRSRRTWRNQKAR
jgi:hypothetical protein